MRRDEPNDAPLTIERIVLEERLTSESSLLEAKRTSLRRHVHLVEVLIDEHTVDEAELADALARRLDLERVHVRGKIDEEAVLEISHDVAAAHLVLPIRLRGEPGEPRTLTVAMVDPLDENARRDVAESTSCSIETQVATLSDVRAALPRYYSSMITKMIPRQPRPGEGPSTQPHVELPDERSLELRFRALVELLTERGVISSTDLDERIKKLIRGDDV